MTSQEEIKIKEWNNQQSDDVQVGLLVTGDERSAELSKFCKELAHISPRVRIMNEEGEQEAPPAIRIGKSLRYNAVPLGMELEPFLQALSHSNDGISGVPSSVFDDLGKLDNPADLILYVSQQCPVCPKVVQQVTPLPGVNELVRLTIIDCTLFPEIAQTNKVQSVPHVVLDGQFRWTGPLQLEELIEVIVNRNPANLSASSLERMLVEGNAVEVAEMMLDKDRIFPPFFDLIVHEKWSVRMGAVVAVEEIVERNKELASQVIEPLWERFNEVEDPIKDDILYIYGIVGDAETTVRLKAILTGQYNTEVKESAREAIEVIEED